MKIVLVKPPFVDSKFGPPIGLAYLCRALKEGGHEAFILDLNLDLKKNVPTPMVHYNRDFILPPDHPAIQYANSKIDEYCDTIMTFQPDVVGFHLSYPTVDFGNKLAKRVSRFVRCIAGGPHTTFHPQNLLNLGCYDAIVAGYGEEAIVEAIKSSGVIQKPLDPSKEYVPDYCGTPIEAYDGVLPIVTTRGCPNRCNFCTHNSPYFFHSIDSVVNQLSESPNITKVMYNDSNINVNQKRTENLFAELSQLKKKPDSHVLGMQIKQGYERYIPKMAEAGVREARLGIESGSVRERRSMNKVNFDNTLVVDFIKQLTTHKILALVQFIFCFPDQTEKDREETVKLIQEINEQCDSRYVKHVFNKFVVHHGTEDYFRKNYGVIATSPQHWENSLYSAEKITKLEEDFSRALPSNCRIYL